MTSELYGALEGARPTWNLTRVPRISRDRLGRRPRSWQLSSDVHFLGKMQNRIHVAYGYTVWPQVVVTIVAIRKRADVIICPNFVFPLLLSRRCLVIVNDVNALKQYSADKRPSKRARWSIREAGERYYFWLIRRSVSLASKRSGGIVVPTTKVRDDLKQVLPGIRVPVFTIPWGVGEEWIDDSANRMNGDLRAVDRSIDDFRTRPFVLCVNPHVYGNVQPIVEAVALFNKNNSSGGIRLELKVVGHLEDAARLPPEVIFLGRVTDADLSDLYKTALVVGIATTDSGFGFPLLEALASGCPCIVRGGTAEAEIASGHGVFVVDDDPEFWVKALESLLFDPDRRLMLSGDAANWAAQFSWKRVGHELAAAIEAVGETPLIQK